MSEWYGFPEKRSKKHQPIIIGISHHFKERFEERWGKQQNIIEYLNKQLSEGIKVKDKIQKIGIYFPSCGFYVPLVVNTFNKSEYFAITFQNKLIDEYKKPIKIKWIEATTSHSPSDATITKVAEVK